MSHIDRTPRSLNTFWSSDRQNEDPQPELQQPTSSNSQYGPQRMSGCGAIPRRNVRQGVSDFVTLSGVRDVPDQAKSATALAKEWVGGTVTLAKGDWGYLGPTPEYPKLTDPITLRILSIVEDADHPGYPVVNIKQDTEKKDYHSVTIPTNAFPGGAFSFSMFSMVGGKWSRPGLLTKIANMVGVSPTVVGLAALGLGAAIVWKAGKKPGAARRLVSSRSNPRRRSNPGPKRKSFYVVRVGGREFDTYAGETLREAMDLAMPDKGDRVEVKRVYADDAGWARLARGGSWRRIR